MVLMRCAFQIISCIDYSHIFQSGEVRYIQIGSSHNLCLVFIVQLADLADIQIAHLRINTGFTAIIDFFQIFLIALRHPQ